ncbi:MAG: Hpt domain-containing protein [Planctomycetes bacterium]|nr:Hpt domain-containing protein [Planctomycetota bacterium]
MDHFSIDDVRGFFLEDMRSFLQRIDECARGIARSERVARKPHVADRRGRGYFDLIGAASGDLERAPRLAGSAAADAPAGLSRLAAFGAERAARLVDGVDELRRMAETASVCVVDLQGLLDASVQRDAERVKALHEAFLRRMAAWLPTIEVGKATGRRLSTDDAPVALERATEAPVTIGETPFRGILNRVESSVTQALDHTRAFDVDPVTPPLEVSLFETLQDCAHSMCGSCSLVGLEPLSECARVLEHFACGARVAAERMTADGAALREAARLARRACAEIAAAFRADDEEQGRERIARLNAAIDGFVRGTPAPAAAPAVEPHERADAAGSALTGATSGETQPAREGLEGADSADDTDRSAAPEFDFGAESESASADAIAASASAENVDSGDTESEDDVAFGFESVVALPSDAAPEQAPVEHAPAEHAPAEVAAARSNSGPNSERNSEPNSEPNVDSNGESNGDAVDHDLLRFFQEEAQQAVVPLQGYLATLRRDPRRVDVVGQLEKLFHTLKGSSATVGLQKVTELSASLEDRMEQTLEGLHAGTARIDAAFVEALVRSTNELLAISGLPEIRLAEPTRSRRESRDGRHGGDGGELRRIFAFEADGICVELEAELDATRDPSLDSAELARRALAVGRMFHKLKGSAVLNDAQRLAEVAGKLQDECEAEPLASDWVERARAALAEVRAELAGLRGDGRSESQISVAASVASETLPSATSEFEVVRESVEIEADAVWEAFEVEASESLDAMDRDVLALEESDQPKELVRRLFRAFHTLKGAANTVGLDPLGRMLHRVEDFLEVLGDADVLPPLKRVTRFLLSVQERVRENLRQARLGYVETSPRRLDAEIEALQSGRAEPCFAAASRAAPASVASSNASSVQSSERSSTPSASSARSGSATSDRASSESQSASSKSSGSKSSTSGGAATRTRERKYIRVPAERLEALMNLTGEIVIDRARLLRRVLTLRTLQRDLVSNRARLLAAVESFREQYEFSGVASKARRASPERVEALVGAGANAFDTRSTRGGGGRAAGRGHGRGSDLEQVFSDLELDRYEDINILSRVLSEVTSDISEVQNQVNLVLEELHEDSDHFSSNVSDLQTEIMRARMVPLDQLFIRLHRPLRDAAEREGKEVRLVTIGEDVTLDKTIIDELYTPMLHLVRNAVSHGVETPDTRRRKGKEVEGVVTLRARQESGQIVLEIRDDGGGLDLDAIRRRGIEMGLVTADTPVDSPAVRNLIFASGLSVRTKANDVAGRGVGCDVVKREIERLNGQIQVESEAGVGTTFTITMPTTLAIYRALVVEHAGQRFAMALNFSEMILDVAESQVVESAGVSRIKFRDGYVALKSLGELLDLAPAEDAPESPSNVAVMLRMGENRLAVRVDRIVGQEEIVVKSLGDLLQDHPMFSGVTIGGDGRLILIADVPGLIQGHRGERDAADSNVEARTAAANESGEARTPERRRTVRVLYVDDSLSVRKAAEKLLKNIGVEVTLAVDGADGLDKMRQGKFDLVFSDLEMPRLNGYDMVRELRYIPAFKDVPVVVVTSRSGEKHRQQAAAVGATDYVTKPFNQEVLAEKLARWANYDPFERGA